MMSKSQTLPKIFSYAMVMKTLWNTSILALINLKCALEILLHNQFLFSPPRLYDFTPSAGCDELIAMTRHASVAGSPEQCSVCLDEVGNGDEVGELRCGHVFHALCLRRWVRCSKRTWCPLCRGSLAPVAGFGSPGGHQGVEVLFFKFCSFSDSEARDDNDSWWLR